MKSRPDPRRFDNDRPGRVERLLPPAGGYRLLSRASEIPFPRKDVQFNKTRTSKERRLTKRGIPNSPWAGDNVTIKGGAAWQDPRCGNFGGDPLMPGCRCNYFLHSGRKSLQRWGRKGCHMDERGILTMAVEYQEMGYGHGLSVPQIDDLIRCLVALGLDGEQLSCCLISVLIGCKLSRQARRERLHLVR